METVYYEQAPQNATAKSIFLAGGSVRPNQNIISWRTRAIKILEQLNFDGIVYVPENKDEKFDEEHNYEQTVEWEQNFLEKSSVIVFWIPRDLTMEDGQLKLPCLTSNIEFGMFLRSGKIVLGIPPNAEKVKYLQYCAKKYNIPSSNNLMDTLKNAIEKMK